MKTLLWVSLALLAITQVSYGQYELAISGPREAQTNERIRLTLDGLPAVTFPLSEEDMEWLNSLNIDLSAPNAAENDKYYFDQELVIKLAPFRFVFRIEFVSEIPGDFVFVVDWNKSPSELLIHRVEVGGENPPLPPPKPEGKYQIVVFYQSGQLDNLSREQRTIISSLKLRQELKEKEHTLQAFDIDLSGPNGIPDGWKPWWNAVNNTGLPVVVLGGEDKEKVTYPLPKNSEELWNLIGGR